MTKTKYYDLQMDDPQDDYDVEVVNANLKKIDEQMKTRENATDALQEPEFTVAEKRENIASKEKMPKILGKIAKFFTDLKTVAFSGKYSDLDGKPAIVNNNTATEAGSALDARQANPTIEGTMANQISQLNSDLSDLNDNSKKITLIPRKWAGVSVYGEAFNVTGAAGGIIFYPHIYLKEIHFFANGIHNNDGVIVQVGACTDDASVPEVFTTGEKRLNYVNYTDSGEIIFNINGSINYFYIAGNVDLSITNLFGILY